MIKKLAAIPRLLLGSIYFVFGLNGFVNFLPLEPPPMPEAAIGFFRGLALSGYFIPLLSGTETIAGLLLLTGLAAPLALVILAPVTLQILLFHVFLTPGWKNLALPLTMMGLHIIAAIQYWSIYRPLFTKKA